jgi:uncharacterized damage-inducible protein DinB
MASASAEIVEKVKTLPDRVASTVAGLSEEELRRRPAEGEWSIKEVCGHLRDDAEVWRRRLELMVSQDNPTLPTCEQEELVRERAYQDADLAAVLADFRRYRRDIAAQLSSLAPGDWERAGNHPERGRLQRRPGSRTY